MKLRKLFATLLALTLLLTACGSAGEENQDSQPTSTVQTVETQTAQITSAPIQTEVYPSADELPIQSIQLSVANRHTNSGMFYYITPTHVLIGEAPYSIASQMRPRERLHEFQKLVYCDISTEEFETLCTALRALRFDLFPTQIERPDSMGEQEIGGASDYRLQIQRDYYTSSISQGYAATEYHEGFAETCQTIVSTATSLCQKYAAMPIEPKPIASILMTSYNGFSSQPVSCQYMTPTQAAIGKSKLSGIISSDPISAPGMLSLQVADIPQGVFDSICEQLWALRFDLLPAEVQWSNGTMPFSDGGNQTITVRFEDGTTLTSGGYAAPYGHDGFGAVWEHLSTNISTLMDAYEVPEKEIKGIAAVLNYTYNAFAAQNGALGYHCYYYSLQSSTVTTWQTMNTPVDLTNPLKTENMVNQSVIKTKDLNSLIQDICALSPETLPETVEPDPNNVIYDGDTQCIVIYYADGTTVTSGGYCATEYNEQFNAVWDCLYLFRAGLGMP